LDYAIDPGLAELHARTGVSFNIKQSMDSCEFSMSEAVKDLKALGKQYP